ncbi:MAG: MFS transporter [Verrucomicrobiae bacterium]|nr:MFS transporter [Verrucomicrobiae bacterium]
MTLTKQNGDAPPSCEPPQIYRLGTLQYTTRGLVALFAWLLWGDFCFQMFESVVPRFVPLYLKELRASNVLIGIMTSGVIGVMNVAFLPWISTWSDRTRSPRGRRIPFLLWATPGTAATLFLIGFVPEIGGWLQGHVFARFWGLPKEAVTLVLLCVFIVLYHFFNMVLNAIYYCLFRDVVPDKVLNRFLALFRIVGTLGGFVFSRYFLGHIMEHRQITFFGFSLLCLVSFWSMCWRIREGDYPPLPPREREKGGTLHVFFKHFRDCFSVPIYRYYYIAQMFLWLTRPIYAFWILLATDTLKLDLDLSGKILGWSLLLQAFLYLPTGYLCDRYHAIRIVIASAALNVVVMLASYFLIHNDVTLLIYTLLAQIPVVWLGLGEMSLGMKLFNGERYGQLSSNIFVVGCGSSIFGSTLLGYLIDAAGTYQVIFLWNFVVCVLASVALFFVYREWKRLGGDLNYAAPLP